MFYFYMLLTIVLRLVFCFREAGNSTGHIFQYGITAGLRSEFCKIADESGLPAGVFNVVTCRGSVVGSALVSSPKVGIVSLTGSVSAGVKIATHYDK